MPTLPEESIVKTVSVKAVEVAILNLLESSISIPYAGGNYGIYLIIGEYTIKKYSDWDY